MYKKWNYYFSEETESLSQVIYFLRISFSSKVVSFLLFCSFCDLCISLIECTKKVCLFNCTHPNFHDLWITGVFMGSLHFLGENMRYENVINKNVSKKNQIWFTNILKTGILNAVYMCYKLKFIQTKGFNPGFPVYRTLL